jgi:hypothetical protein
MLPIVLPHGLYRTGRIIRQVDINATLWQCQASKNLAPIEIYSIVSNTSDLIVGCVRIGTMKCGSKKNQNQ